MTLLRQVDRPGSAASWVEHLYAKEIRIVNGEVEIDNTDGKAQGDIDILLGRGFKVIPEDQRDAVITKTGTVSVEKEVEPQGSQVPLTEPEKVEAPTVKEVSNKSQVALPPRGKSRGRPKKSQGVK